MTTDVTEAVETEAVIEPVVEPVVETTPESTEEPTSSAIDLLKELGEEVEEPETPAEEEVIPPEVLAAATKLRESDKAQEQRTNEENQKKAYEAGVTRSFQERGPKLSKVIEQFLEAKGVGYEEREGFRNFILTEFSQHHGQSLALTKIESAAHARDFREALYVQVGKILPAESAKVITDAKARHTSTEAFLEDVVVEARKGLLTPKQAKEQVDKAKVTLIEKLYKDGRLAGGKTLETGGAQPAGTKSMTLEQIDRMPTAEWMNIPKERRDKILADAHAKAK